MKIGNLYKSKLDYLPEYKNSNFTSSLGDVKGNVLFLNEIMEFDTKIYFIFLYKSQKYYALFYIENKNDYLKVFNKFFQTISEVKNGNW